MEVSENIMKITETGRINDLGIIIKLYLHRCMLGFGIIPATLMFLGLWFTPETPRWLVFHNNVDKARKTLKRVRHWSVVDDELAKITQARDKSTQGDSISKSILYRSANKKVYFHTKCIIVSSVITISISSTFLILEPLYTHKYGYAVLIPLWICWYIQHYQLAARTIAGALNIA